MSIHHAFAETARTRRTLALSLGLALALSLLLGVQAAEPARAATPFTVNQTGD